MSRLVCTLFLHSSLYLYRAEIAECCRFAVLLWFIQPHRLHSKCLSQKASSFISCALIMCLCVSLICAALISSCCCLINACQKESLENTRLANIIAWLKRWSDLKNMITECRTKIISELEGLLMTSLLENSARTYWVAIHHSSSRSTAKWLLQRTWKILEGVKSFRDCCRH